MSGKDVANAIKCNPATVSQWINHDDTFRKALEDFAYGISRLAELQIESLTLTATSKLKDLLENAQSEQVRLKAIELVLGTVGIGNNGQATRSGYRHREEFIATDSAFYEYTKLIDILEGQ